MINPSLKILQVGDAFTVGAVSLRLHLRLQRHLRMPTAVPEDEKHEIPDEVLKAAQMQQTLRLDPGKLKMAITTRVPGRKEAISWKNVEPRSEKTKTRSLWGRVFNKKKSV